MIRMNQTLCAALAVLAFTGCHNNKEADSADDVHDGSAEHDADRQSQDAEESMQEAEEDMDEAADEVKDEVDGDPTTE